MVTGVSSLIDCAGMALHTNGALLTPMTVNSALQLAEAPDGSVAENTRVSRPSQPGGHVEYTVRTVATWPVMLAARYGPPFQP